MTTGEAPARPEWLAPGAEVVLWTVGRSGPEQVRVDVVHRVAAKSFQVCHPSEPRINIATLTGVISEGAWSRSRHVAPAGSDKAREVLRADRVRELTSAADRAYDAWRRSRTTEARRVLIEALQAIEDER